MFKVQHSLSTVCACTLKFWVINVDPSCSLQCLSCLVDNPFSVTGADAALKFLANFTEVFFIHLLAVYIVLPVYAIDFKAIVVMIIELCGAPNEPTVTFYINSQLITITSCTELQYH